jgi:hypothetical protein
MHTPTWEEVMIEVTDSARRELLESLKDQDGNPAVRIYPTGVG